MANRLFTLFQVNGNFWIGALGNIGDVRLTSWGNISTLQDGEKRPSNVEITCHQSMSFPTFIQYMQRKGVDFY